MMAVEMMWNCEDIYDLLVDAVHLVFFFIHSILRIASALRCSLLYLLHMLAYG
jgi:hypothetical protein